MGIVIEDPKGELSPMKLASRLIPKRDGESIYDASARDILTSLFSVVTLDPFPAAKSDQKPGSADN